MTCEVIPDGAHRDPELAFGPDGYLYIAVGDGGSGNDPPNNAQNKNVLPGKLLRIDINAPGVPQASPPDNPFFGPPDGLDEIFAYGMRNPWHFSFDRQTGDPWVGDVGQGGASGSGSGTVTYDVAPYTGKPKNRNGTITIAGQTFSIKQSK